MRRISKLALFARDITQVLERVAPLMAVVRAAAETQPELAEVYSALHRGRTANLTKVVEALLRHGPLRTARGDAVAVLSRLASPELFLLVTKVEGLSLTQYRAWLLDVLTALLLPDEANRKL
jgi:hypothetical protein